MTNDSTFRNADEFTRRAFLTRTAGSLLGLGAMPLLANAVTRAGITAAGPDAIALGPATARNVIYLFMAGGMSHIDTFDPKPGSETQGPVQAIRTRADDVMLSEYFPNLAERMDKVALVRSLKTKTGAHAPGRYLMHTSYEKRGTIAHPSLGAWTTRMAGGVNPALPGHVAIGPAGEASAGFLDATYAPLPIGDPAAGLQYSELAEDITDERFHRRLAHLERMNTEFEAKYDHAPVHAYTKMYEQAVRLMSSSDLEAFDITREPEVVRAAYGSDRFGQGCLLARRLVEHGVRFVEVVNGGWDTHNDNFDTLAEKVPVLDRALSALLSDLESRGLLEETLVVVATEFGRTPEIATDRMGRDHYPSAFSSLLAGGGIRGGRAFGKTDATGAEVIEDPVSAQDFNATIAYALGLPLEHELVSPSGRPFTVADKGTPIRSLFA